MALAPYCSIRHLKIKGVSSDWERSVGTLFDNYRRIVVENLKLSKKNEKIKGGGQVLSQEGDGEVVSKGNEDARLSGCLQLLPEQIVPLSSPGGEESAMPS